MADRPINSSRLLQQNLPIGDIGQEIYLREEQKPEALAGQTAISGIDRHDIIQMAIEPT
jgi:hypothetical protein